MKKPGPLGKREEVWNLALARSQPEEKSLNLRWTCTAMLASDSYFDTSNGT